MEGCVNGAGRLTSGAGLEGGARLSAPPEGSGTDAGGTGGGRSVNICAEAGAAMAKASIAASAGANSRRAPCPDSPLPLPPEAMRMLFTENAANSSLPAQGMAAHGTGKTPEYCSRGRGPVTIPAQADPA
jgi:hypothetical protein